MATRMIRYRFALSAPMAASELFRAVLALVFLAALSFGSLPALGDGGPDSWLRQANADSALRHDPGFGPVAEILPGLPANPSADFGDA